METLSTLSRLFVCVYIVLHVLNFISYNILLWHYREFPFLFLFLSLPTLRNRIMSIKPTQKQTKLNFS